jgi:hypothetical protein
MQKISYWASRNIVSARSLIVAIKILLAVISYYIGMELFKMKLLIPAVETYCITWVLLFAAISCYPAGKKNATLKEFIYARQKACDFILPFCAVLFLITWFNNAGTVPATTAYGSTIIKHPSARQILNAGKTKQTLTGKEKRILKKEFFKQLKVYGRAIVTGDKAKAGEALTIILAIVALLGLLYLLAALVCSLSCSGADVLAIFVGVIGLAGLIWGFVAIINNMHRKRKKTIVQKDK